MLFLLDHLPTPTPVLLTGAAGLIVGTLSTLLADRRSVLGAQAVACLLFALHYSHLDARTGMLMCALGLMQMATAFPAERPRWTAALFAGTALAGIGVAALTWKGPVSALSAAGFLLGTMARWQTSVGAMHRCSLAATITGAGHNALAGSLFGVCADALGLCGLLWSLRRERCERARPSRAQRAGV